LRFHDLRRTYASILIAGGCDGPYVAQQLGHSVEVLYSTYAGLFNSRSQAERGLAAIHAARGEA
jgi:integrase